MIMSASVYYGTEAFSNKRSSIPVAEENIPTDEQVSVIHDVILNVPLINQMDPPRLKSGCEVTSLAMILNYKGIQVTKNQLAQEIAKVPLRYDKNNYGNPNFGFVGNMEEGGLGVYHGPMIELAKRYVQDRVTDLTNQPFDVLLNEVSEGNPVWILTTKTFAPVSDFMSWQTPQGPVDVTYSMHSVVITGFDQEYIYVNNPYGTKNQQFERDSFMRAWEQMGKQAIVID
jgi:uncharacterized protein YvpB